MLTHKIRIVAYLHHYYLFIQRRFDRFQKEHGIKELLLLHAVTLIDKHIFIAFVKSTYYLSWALIMFNNTLVKLN